MATRSRRARPYRIGDRVRVLLSRPILRVGYPLIWYELLDEVKADPRTYAAWSYLRTGLTEPAEKQDGLLSAPAATDVPPYFAKAVAMLRVEERGFGGNERRIIYEKPGDPGLADWTGSVLTVVGKRVAYTGKRFAPRWGVVDTYDGPDYWEESGGLYDSKAHILLSLSAGITVEACDVELVEGTK